MILFLLLACGAAAEKETCESLCDVMYKECEYGAYPSYESCLQGCAYQQSEGGNVEGELVCIEKAECDTFAILECEHKFGPGSSEE
ncbi:MAG: hypothetical protein Q8P41_22495 [Pseudomonadota bacterium]|nr:hypothetical protein [Pseudomonadota bacterium]